MMAEQSNVIETVGLSKPLLGKPDPAETYACAVAEARMCGDH